MYLVSTFFVNYALGFYNHIKKLFEQDNHIKKLKERLPLEKNNPRVSK